MQKKCRKKCIFLCCKNYCYDYYPAENSFTSHARLRSLEHKGIERMFFIAVANAKNEFTSRLDINSQQKYRALDLGLVFYLPHLRKEDFNFKKSIQRQ